MREAIDLLEQDSAARERALDVGRSFLVQAPAGSGKTGLLIQRFLASLAHVDRPERIVAMTFTRKAAGEMRERIVAALEAAHDETTSRELEPHERRTIELARAALAQDRRHGWQLVTHPSRLAIDTIDAIAAGFARQAPMTTGLGASPRYVDDATELYVEAARVALASASTADAAWRLLVAHDDNRAGSLVALLAGLLAKRDQWLEALVGAKAASLRGALDRALAREIEDELVRAHAALAAHAEDVVERARYASMHIDSDAAQALSRCAKSGLPTTSADTLDDWRTLADWLLVKGSARMRGSVNKNSGFPSAASGRRASVEKDAMHALLRRLAAEPAICVALDTVRRLPARRIGDDTWAIVEALHSVLPRLAAQLNVTFSQHGQIDFVEGALAALRALGEADSPSDLLLRLDGAIAHLLIDEFQDTSFTQLQLIERLTAGWTPGDGRTLFAVGDPMQSIYRFRAAEVRLFVEAQEQRQIGAVPVDTLTLRRNFRSQATLVGWINRAFPSILGRVSDPPRGVVAFAEASAQRPEFDGAGVTFDALPSTADEARSVVAHVQRALAAGDESIAILVRTRRHAAPFMPALRSAGIAFTAVELDAFVESGPIRDLTALTHALVQPADRLAWLAVLRAPWCGLLLPDLVAVAASDPTREQTLVGALSSPAAIAGLSDDGRMRLERVADVLLPALASRGRASVAARIRGAWLALGGPAFVDDESGLDAAERFFALVAEREAGGDLVPWEAFIGALERLREQDVPADVRVRVMTLHKAKGLEFDTVVMPALGGSGRSADSDLLRWRRRPHGLLIAPSRAPGAEPDAIYAYLTQLAAAEDAAELSRLLYVGCTRAKRRLHLTATMRPRRDADAQPCWPKPSSDSFLARLWPLVCNDVAPPAPADERAPVRAPIALTRVARDWRPHPPDGALASPREFDVDDQTPPFDWVRETARRIGVVVHRMFAQIGSEGPATWSSARIDALAPTLAATLAAQGVDAEGLADAVVQAQQALRAVLDDARARWLFDPNHSDVRSEWALAGIDGGELVHRTLDRTFVDGGVRWIVDYKTGRHEGGDLDEFLDRERVRYAPALETYARLVRGLDSRPIRLALYHPLVRGWREWPFAG